MNYKNFRITAILFSNHIKLIKNWLLYENNKIVIILPLVLYLLSVLGFSTYFGDQSDLSSQIASILFTTVLPISITRKYYEFIEREETALRVMFNKKDLLVSKQILITTTTLALFCIILLSGIIPHLWLIPVPYVIASEILVLAIYSLSLPYISTREKFKNNISKSSRFWNLRIERINLLPVRGIALREFLNLSRNNNKYIIRILINVILINGFLILFLINNDFENYFTWPVLLQVIIFITFVINYPIANDTILMKSMPCREFYIIKGEFIFWFSLFLIYLIIITVIYTLISAQISLPAIAITIILFAVLLYYVLLVRLAYADNEFTRTLIFLMMIIPITIPFYFYTSYRRLKC